MTPNVRAQLDALLAKRILVLDGAMGTMIQRHQLTEADFRGERFTDHPHDLRGDNDLLVLTRPDVIAEIHHQYLEAGADIIETNTFSGTAIAQADYGLESLVYELNLEGAKLARAACDEWTAQDPSRPRFVAGSIGPTNRTLSISPDVNNPAFRDMTFDALNDAFKEQARGLIDGGCDLLLLETIFDTLNAKAAIVAIEEVFDERRTPNDRTAAADDLGHDHRSQRPDAVGPDDRRVLGVDRARAGRSASASTARSARATCGRTSRSSRGIADCYVSCYPNAGLPNAFGDYDEQAGGDRRLPARVRHQRLRQHRRRLLRHDAGSHRGDRRRRRRAAAAHHAPQHSALSTPRQRLAPQFAGLETLTIRPESNFQMIGERTNVTGSPKFARLIQAGDYATATRGGARAGARRRQPHRRQHGRRHARFRAGDDGVPQLHRDRAGHRARAVHDRQLEVVGDPRRAEVRAGQAGRQLDQPQGRRGRLPGEGGAWSSATAPASS